MNRMGPSLTGFIETWNQAALHTSGPGILRAAAWLILGTLLVRMLSGSAGRWFDRHSGAHSAGLASRGILYAGFALIAAAVLSELGFKLAPIWGAAGIAGVALGFASQNSLANIISGLFLVAEKPFQVGDLIRVGETTGEVLAIDGLSVKLRSFDNTLIRIPNESMLKSQVINITRFPIRRVDMNIAIAYKEDIGRVHEVLNSVARDVEFCLREPKPVFIILGFGASSIDLQFSVWARKEKFLDVRNACYETIKRRFDEEGIEIPFPHLSLYAGRGTDPFPVRMDKAGPVIDPAGSVPKTSMELR